MRVPILALNGTIFDSKNSGAKQRFVGLFSEVIKQEHDFNYHIFSDLNGSIQDSFKRLENINFIESPLPADRPLIRYIKGIKYWKNKLTDLKPNILDNSHLPLIKNNYGATFLTIHDIRYLKHPELYSRTRRWTAPSILKKSVKNADVIITVSETAKNEILQFVEHSRIVVITNGISSASMANPTINESKTIEKIGIRSPYLLSVGHLEKRKNFCNLIKAFQKVRERKRDLQLVIVGNIADDFKNIKKTISELNLEKSVFLLPNLDIATIAALYKNTELFIFSSIYEGFGIPLLEALHYGCRIVMSDIPIFKEITDNTAIYFEPKNIFDMAEKIESMLNTSQLDANLFAHRDSILKRYTYENSARQYVKLIKSVV